MEYTTVTQIREANQRAGYHFFDPGTIESSGSIILPGVMRGSYFVTSEQDEHDVDRRYTLRRAMPDGRIVNASNFREFASAREARAAVSFDANV